MYLIMYMTSMYIFLSCMYIYLLLYVSVTPKCFPASIYSHNCINCMLAQYAKIHKCIYGPAPYESMNRSCAYQLNILRKRSTRCYTIDVDIYVYYRNTFSYICPKNRKKKFSPINLPKITLEGKRTQPFAVVGLLATIFSSPSSK